MKKYLEVILFLFTLGSGDLYAQLQGQARADSLLKEMPRQKEDTNKVKLLLDLSNTYNYDGAVADANSALELSKKLNWKKGIARAYFSFGSIYRSQVNYPKALENLMKALPVYKEIGNKRMAAWTLNYIGKTYYDLSDFTSALNYFSQSLDIFTEIGDEYSMAAALNDIGNYYWEQKKYEKSFEYYSAALKKYEESGRINGIAAENVALGDYFTKIGDYENALSHYLKGLRIFDNVPDRSDNIAGSYMSVSKFYLALAADSNKSALNKLCKGNKKAALQKSMAYLDTAYAVCMEVGGSPASVYQNYSNTKAALGDYKGALDDHLRYIAIRDSQFSAENHKRFNQLTMQFLFDKKEDSVKMEVAKAEAAHKANEKRQKTIIYSAVGGLALLLAFLFFVQKEKRKADHLLLNILPAEVARELKAKGSAEAKLIEEVTVLFTDFKGFTQLSEKLSPKALVAEINECFSAFDLIMQKYGVEKIKTIGDSYMAAGGLPTPNKTHPEDVVKAAVEIQQFMQAHKSKKTAAGELFFEIRIGVHTGPVVAGIVGVKKFQYDIWGDTVNTASRMESSGTVGRVNISEATYELVKDKISCEFRGEIDAKGKGAMKMYYVS